MYLRRDFSYLFIILIVHFIPHTTSLSCKQEESFWQGLPGRVWDGSSPRTRNDPSKICQAFTFLEDGYEALCTDRNGNTRLEYWLGAFGASSAPEGITIHNGVCQISEQMLSFSAKIADILLYVYNSIHDVDLASNWNEMVTPVFEQIVSINWKGIVGYEGDCGCKDKYPHTEDLVDLVRKIYEVFWKILTIMQLKEGSMPAWVDYDDIIAMETENGKRTRFTWYIIGICTVFATVCTYLAAVWHRRYRRNAPGQVVKPLRAMPGMKFTMSFMTYSEDKRAGVHVECLRSHVTSSARSQFRKKMRVMRTMKDLGAANQPSLIYLKEWFATGELYLAMPNMRYGELLGLMKYCPEQLDFNSRISVFKQIFPAVEWLHQEGWAHLNIHPGAIFVGDANYQVKLGKFTHAVETNKRASNYHLHPNCCGPEVLRQRPYDAKKADFWALGALLFSLFSNMMLPFRGFKPLPSHLNPCLVGFGSPAHSDKLIKVMFNLLCGRTKDRPVNIEILNTTVNEH